MALRRLLLEPKTPAELALSSCSESSVACWRMPGQSGVVLAVILQFHTAEHEALDGHSARLRFAARNHYPQEFFFTRELKCQGCTPGTHSQSSRLRIRPAQSNEDKVRVRHELLEDVVPVQRLPGADSAELDAHIHIVDPKALGHIRAALSVTFPGPGRRRCACCSRYFPS